MTAPLFGTTIAESYDRLMVPMLFEPYARDLVERVRAREPVRVLEIAAGTGVVTRALVEALPASTTIVATDLNVAMIERGAQIGTARPVEWRTADAQQLPFADAAFDLVACQFGIMFVPDRVAAYREMRRVLSPGGRAVFSTWDSLAHNELAACVNATMEQLFPELPPDFLARGPHGYFDPATIRRELAAAGFTAEPAITIVTERSRAAAPSLVALAYCGGSPLRNELGARGAVLENVIAAVTERITQRFGSGAIDAKMQAFVVEIDR